MIQLNISPSSGIPIYKQVLEQVETMILSGQLIVGELLPSVRHIAGELNVNPMTISKAYGLLEERGFLERLRGKGMAVAERDDTISKEEKLDMLGAKIKQLVVEAQQMGIKEQELLALFQQSLKQEEKTQKQGA